MDVGLPTHLGLGHLGRDRGLVGLDVVDKGDRDGELGLAWRLYPSQLKDEKHFVLDLDDTAHANGHHCTSCGAGEADFGHPSEWLTTLRVGLSRQLGLDLIAHD